MSYTIKTADSPTYKQLLNHLYWLVCQNEQKDVVDVITYDYTSADDAAATAPEIGFK